MILDAEERLEKFNSLIRSEPWVEFLNNVVRDEAKRARSTLLTSHSMEEIRAAQEALRVLKRMAEYPYRITGSENLVPKALSLLWDP